MPDKKNSQINKTGSPNLNRYETDVAGVSMKRLEAGLWWVKNRQTLKTVLVVFLIAVSVISWGYTIYGFGNYLLFGMSSDDQTMQAFLRTTVVDQNFLAQHAAKDLNFSAPGFIADDGKYDLYLQVANPNARWWATFDYCFSRSNGEQACANDFILPGGTKYILSLSQTFQSNPADLKFSLSDITWHKIDNHVINNWDQYLADHQDIAITGQLFTPAANNAVSEKLSLNSLSFNLSDNGAYSYYNLPLTILLTNGNQIVYIDRDIISGVVSHSSYPVELTWPGSISGVTGISITPDLNILDQGIYQKPQ